MTSFRHYQSPPVGMEHPNHVTYLHEGTISEEKNQAPGMSNYIIGDYGDLKAQRQRRVRQFVGGLREYFLWKVKGSVKGHWFYQIKLRRLLDS